MCAMAKEKAKESAKIKKARAKLKKQLASEDKQVTPDALNKMSQAIRTWITRHAEERVNLREKTFRLFDENKHPAGTKSQFVREKRSLLRKEAEKEEKAPKSLAGRVAKQDTSTDS